MPTNRVNILSFLMDKLDHVKHQGLQVTSRCQCLICRDDLLSWINYNEGIFKLRWQDKRCAYANHNDHLFQLYMEESGLSKSAKTPPKLRMKAAIDKQVKNGTLLLLSPDTDIEEKIYKIIPNIRYRHARVDFKSSELERISHQGVAQVEEVTSVRVHNISGVSSATQSSSSKLEPFRKSPEFISTGIHTDQEGSYQPSRPSVIVRGRSIVCNGSTMDINPGVQPQTSVLDEMKISQKTFDDFMGKQVVINFVETGLIGDYLDEIENCELLLAPLLDMEIEVQLQGVGKLKLLARNSMGFRLLADETQLMESSDPVANFGPKDLQHLVLPKPSELNLKLRNEGLPTISDGISQCLETLEKSGLVFLWKHYDVNNLPPNIRGERLRTLEKICWRLYCYRICRGFKPRTLDDQHSSLSKLCYLNMMVGRGKTCSLDQHQFTPVLDLAESLATLIFTYRSQTQLSIDQLDSQHSNIQSWIGMVGNGSRAEDFPVKLMLSSSLCETFFRDNIASWLPSDGQADSPLSDRESPVDLTRSLGTEDILQVD